jgi:surfactin synthase thioesterase subunit
MFPGGHFFLHEAPEEFLAAIEADLLSDGWP